MRDEILVRLYFSTCCCHTNQCKAILSNSVPALDVIIRCDLPLSECEQNQRADCGLQEETAAALHSSYDQWDPCGEGEQLQVPRCKHLRGPILDCTHSDSG